MTDQPSQRAMKAAEWESDFGDHTTCPICGTECRDLHLSDTQFPAYLEIREALRELLFRFRRVAADFSGEIDPADKKRIAQAEAALAKARKD